MLAFGNSRPETVAEPTATDAPTISRADEDAAADQFVREIAIARGIRADDQSLQKLMSYEFDDSDDIEITGTPEDREQFMRVLRRAIVVDPDLEVLVDSARAGGIRMTIDAIRGDTSGVRFGSAGSRSRLDRVGSLSTDSVVPLLQRVDMDDIDALPHMMRTDAPGNQQSQEIVMAHEIRELIITSLITDAAKLGTEAGRKVYSDAHAIARNMESDIRLLTRPGRRVDRIHRGADGPTTVHADSPEGTEHVMRFDYNDGSQVEIDMNADREVLGVRETRPPARRVPTRQGSN